MPPQDDAYAKSDLIIRPKEHAEVVTTEINHRQAAMVTRVTPFQTASSLLQKLTVNHCLLSDLSDCSFRSHRLRGKAHRGLR